MTSRSGCLLCAIPETETRPIPDSRHLPGMNRGKEGRRLFRFLRFSLVAYTPVEGDYESRLKGNASDREVEETGDYYLNIGRDLSSQNRFFHSILGSYFSELLFRFLYQLSEGIRAWPGLPFSNLSGFVDEDQLPNGQHVLPLLNGAA